MSNLPLPPPMSLSTAYPEEAKLASCNPIKPEGTGITKLERVEQARPPHHPLAADLSTLEETKRSAPARLPPVVKAQVPPVPHGVTLPGVPLPSPRSGSRPPRRTRGLLPSRSRWSIATTSDPLVPPYIFNLQPQPLHNEAPPLPPPQRPKYRPAACPEELKLVRPPSIKLEEIKLVQLEETSSRPLTTHIRAWRLASQAPHPSRNPPYQGLNQETPQDPATPPHDGRVLNAPLRPWPHPFSCGQGPGPPPSASASGSASVSTSAYALKAKVGLPLKLETKSCLRSTETEF